MTLTPYRSSLPAGSLDLTPDSLLRTAEVRSRRIGHGRVVAKQADCQVAVRAEQSSDLTRFMAVIYGEVSIATAWRIRATDRADPSLRLEHHLVIVARDAVTTLQELAPGPSITLTLARRVRPSFSLIDHVVARVA
jgi:hypothetical protein